MSDHMIFIRHETKVEKIYSVYVNNNDGPPPEFPLALPLSDIVHHLLGSYKYALTRTLH